MSYIARNSNMGEIPTNVTLFQRIKDAYSGSGSFADGSILMKHDRETVAGYTRRKDSISYANFFRPLIDVQTNAVYGREPQRTTEVVNAQWDLFTKNVDGRNNMTQFMKKVATTGKKLGSAWVFMDNAPDAPSSLEEAISKRAIPYLFVVEPHMIRDFSLSAMGHLESVSYFERHVNDDNEVVYWYKSWTPESITLYDDSGLQQSIHTNELGIVPCVVFVSSGDDLEEGEVPFPEYVNIYQLNKKIVETDSLITNGMYQQGFSILTLAGKFDSDLEIGESAALNYDKEGTGTVPSPSFIAPASSPIDLMMKYIEVLKVQIQEQSIADFSTSKSDNQSGIAKRLDNLNRSESLENLAKALEQVESRIAFIFGIYISTDLGFVTEYNKNYDIDDIKTALEEATMALGITWDSQAVVKAIKTDQIKKYFGEKDPKTIADLVEAEFNATVQKEPASTQTPTTENIHTNVPTENIHTNEPKQDSEDISKSADELTSVVSEFRVAIDKALAAAEEAKRSADEQIARANSMVVAKQAEADAERLKAIAKTQELISRLMTDVRNGMTSEEQARAVLASYGFDDAKITLILSKVTVVRA